MTEMINKSENKVNPKRFLFLYIILSLIFLFFIYRLFLYQIVQGQVYFDQAEDNRTLEISDPSQRGIIYDRNGYILARNIPSYNIVVTPANLPDDEGAIQSIYRELSAVIDLPVNRGDVEEAAKNFTPCYNDLGIEEIVFIADTNWPFGSTEIKCDVSKEVAMIVLEKSSDWPGIGVTTESIREYPTGNLTAEIIGFLGPIPAALEDYYTDLGFVSGRDKVGYAGIENTMQEVLGGRNGTRVVEVASGGEIIRNLEEPVDPIPGQDIHLTIDTRLQAVAREALISELNYWNTKAGKTLSSNGVVIAMNPQTGEILSLVSYPNYENNRMSRFIPGYYYEQLSRDDSRPLFNHAISAEHPPGSVFKLASALGILNEGVVTPDYQVDDPGKITIIQQYYINDPGSERNFVCWLDTGHGMVDFLHGIADSCNVYWYKVTGGYKDQVAGNGLGIWRLGEYARALGYDELTGIELPGEADGLIPDPTWKRLNLGENWATGDTYIAAVGQGYVLATPIQVLNSISTIANGGKLMELSLVKEVVDFNGVVTQKFEPSIRWDVTKDPVIELYNDNIPTGEMVTIQPWVIELAKEGMRMVVTEGTAKAEFEGDTTLSAGKTGTAEYCDNFAQDMGLCGYGIGTWPAHAWYVGYAPYDVPEIAVVAFVYNGTEGSTFSAPIVRKVLNAYFEFKAIDSANNP
jgi:penicillin-binding protein 2